MQLAAGAVHLPSSTQDGSIGRHRRAAVAASSSVHTPHHSNHRQLLPSQLRPGSLLAILLHSRRSASAAGAATAVAVGTTTGSAPQLQPQQGQDLGYPRTLLRDYVLLQTLGKGGNGVVVLAKRRHEDSAGADPPTFAIKSIPKVLKEGSELKRANHLASIQQEVDVLKRLRGSLNVVSLEGVYEDDTHVHLVMEHCAGGELTTALSRRHHSERAVASYMRAVLRTLAQCHVHHILHRDVKPGNFMLLSDDERAPIRAIDFGLATPFHPDQLPCTNLGLEGTPWFMAPEVLSSKVLPASDVWSAGVMCFQLLTGRMPFDDRHNPTNPSINAIWRSILFDELDFLKPWWRGISAEAKDFVRLLLQRDPAARPSAKEALRHPWLVGDSRERSVGRRLQRSVVARIQRFAGSSVFKRSVLQMIALDLLRQDEEVPDAVSVAPSLQQLCHALSFDPVTDDVPEQEVSAALLRLGRLTEPEARRLLEQLDPARTGRISRAALVASQVDWRLLQRQNSRRWECVARRVFCALDADGDGVLRCNEVAGAVMRALPDGDGELAALVQEAMQEAREAGVLLRAAGDADDAEVEDDADDGEDGDEHWHQGGGGGVACGAAPGHHDDGEGLAHRTQWLCEGQGVAEEGIRFDIFMRLLKANSLDSLDMYDDRAASASLRSVEHLNALRRTGSGSASPSSGSQHNSVRHGMLGSGSGAAVHGGAGSSQRCSVDGVGPAPAALPAPGAAQPCWRFDVGEQAATSGSSGRAQGAGPAGPASAGPAGSNGAVVAWRFDLGGRSPASGGSRAASSSQPVLQSGAGVVMGGPAGWRFDVGQESSQGLYGEQAQVEGVSGAVQSGDGLALVAVAPSCGEQSGGGNRGPPGGWFDARQHGSTLFYATAKLGSAKGGSSPGALPPVCE